MNDRERIAELAGSSCRVIITRHAEERMIERGITRTQVLRCLQYGHPIEGPARNIKGHCQMTLETISAGDPMSVVAVLEECKNGNNVVVITAYYSR